MLHGTRDRIAYDSRIEVARRRAREAACAEPRRGRACSDSAARPYAVRSTCTHVADSLRSGSVPCARARAAAQASEFFCEHVLQDLLVERQVRDDALEAVVFILELLQPLRFGGAHTPVLLL